MNTSLSSSTRTGKIARLPKALREELNHRLSQNIPARELIAWLNALPEVKSILTAHFHSRPVNAQNISNWRRHGFAEWQARESFLSGLRTIAEDAAGIASALGNLTDHAARLLALHFTRILCPSETIRGKERQSPGLPDASIKILCQMSTAIAALRRGDHAHARLQQQNQASVPSVPPVKPSPTPSEPEIKPNQAYSNHIPSRTAAATSPSVPSVPSVPFILPPTLKFPPSPSRTSPHPQTTPSFSPFRNVLVKKILAEPPGKTR